MISSKASGQESSEPLQAALAALERVLETPLVPGELVAWIQSAQEALASLKGHAAVRIAEQHPKLLSQIEQQDMELASRVERLRDEDAAILHNVAAFQYSIDELAAVAADLEPREDRIHDHLQELIQDGIDLIVRIRKQEVAIDNWFVESLFRDRGVRD